MRVRLWKGVLWWLLQAAASLVLCTLATLTIWRGTELYAALAWSVLPAWGLFSAYFVVRRGVNNYLAWVSPPVAVFAAHYIVTGYTPGGAGPTLLTALLSIVGAAAGLVAGGSREKEHPRSTDAKK